MYNVDIHSEAEDWLFASNVFETAVAAAEDAIGVPEDLHDDVEEPLFDGSIAWSDARDAAIEAVADALHDDISAIIEDYLERHRDDIIADAVQDAVQDEYEKWHDGVIDESDDLKEENTE